MRLQPTTVVVGLATLGAIAGAIALSVPQSVAQTAPPSRTLVVSGDVDVGTITGPVALVPGTLRAEDGGLQQVNIPGETDVVVRNAVLTVKPDDGAIFAISSDDGGSPTFGLTDEAIRAIVAPIYSELYTWPVPVDGGQAWRIPPLLPDGGSGANALRETITFCNESNSGNARIGPRAPDGGLPSCGVYGFKLNAGACIEYQTGPDTQFYGRWCQGTDPQIISFTEGVRQ